MAYVSRRVSVGLEPVYNKDGFAPNPVNYPLTPNTAFKQGQLVKMLLPGNQGAGLLLPAANTDLVTNAIIVGVMAHAVTTADNPAGGVSYGAVYDNPNQVFQASFVPSLNGNNAAGGGTTTTLLTGIAIAAADVEKVAGAVLYMYAGAGAPAMRIIDNSTEAGVLSWTKALDVATDASTKYFVLAPADLDNVGVGPGSSGVLINAQGTAVLATGVNANGLLNVVSINPEFMLADVVIRNAAHIHTR